MLEINGHGGNWAEAMKQFDCAADDLLEYSSNINPLGPPAALKSLWSSEWAALPRYPDPEVRELREAIAAKYGIASDSVLAANGAAEAIDLAVRALHPKKVGVIEPAFSEYREAAEKYGAEVITITASESDAFAVSIEEAVSLLAQVDVLFLGSPNNPTGFQWLRNEILQLARHAEQSGAKLVIDEAFLNFSPNEAEMTMIRDAAASETFIVLRSMTKFYAIPGLRLGFAVAAPALIREMKRLQVPWSVNHLAQKAGVLALEDSEYEKRTRLLIAEERQWLSCALARMGLRAFPGSANYILVKMSENYATARKLQEQLGRQCILIRCCTTFKGLDDQYFRIAVRTRPENERFAAALEAVLSQRVQS